MSTYSVDIFKCKYLKIKSTKQNSCCNICQLQREMNKLLLLSFKHTFQDICITSGN